MVGFWKCLGNRALRILITTDPVVRTIAPNTHGESTGFPQQYIYRSRGLNQYVCTTDRFPLKRKRIMPSVTRGQCVVIERTQPLTQS
ncbi:hypothetical protein V3C99_004618 [Haemonchus contortus]